MALSYQGMLDLIKRLFEKPLKPLPYRDLSPRFTQLFNEIALTQSRVTVQVDFPQSAFVNVPPANTFIGCDMSREESSSVVWAHHVLVPLDDYVVIATPSTIDWELADNFDEYPAGFKFVRKEENK